MGAVRRSHVAALAGVAALLLLLLARLPPPAALPPPPAPLYPRETSTVPPPPTPAANKTTPAPVTSPPVPVKSVPPAPLVVVPPKVTVKNSSAPVLTGDVYVAGHERPHPELCPSLGAKLRLLILVTSAPSHSAAREAVRMTWGHFNIRSDIAFAFVIGIPPDTVRPAIEAEDMLYGDIIVGRFLDSYSNLTLKTLSMLEWVDTYCPRVQRILKTDDDMFINVPKLMEFAKAPSRVNATKTIWGKVVKKSLPKRTSRSKYYVSPLQFPGKVFPDFTTGPAYLLTTDVIRDILAAAPAEPYLRLEDVFVTGVLGSKLGIKRQHATEFYNRKIAHPCAVQRGIAVHMVRFHEQFDLWRKLLDGKMKCAS
ncbi:beta-1,3-galactosyltransferase 5-like [Amyelois transitella]|uniref:beta-1,3-galactosyltransferase 5-like n=1 Tax=Amyelois transitella TaxID=680683 RepID=UPI00298F681B|nr:beta-1,3-galactosyltransferase 5-like [Amyelois transitella]